VNLVTFNKKPAAALTTYQVRTRGGRSHFFRLRLRSCTKIFEPGPGNFQIWESNSCRLWILSIQPKISPFFHFRNHQAESRYCRNWKVAPDPGSDIFRFENPTLVQTRDGADRKFVPAVRIASAFSVCYPYRIHICCILPCPHPRCTAIPMFYPLTAMTICAPSPEALYFS